MQLVYSGRDTEWDDDRERERENEAGERQRKRERENEWKNNRETDIEIKDTEQEYSVTYDVEHEIVSQTWSTVYPDQDAIL